MFQAKLLLEILFELSFGIESRAETVKDSFFRAKIGPVTNSELVITAVGTKVCGSTYSYSDAPALPAIQLVVSAPFTRRNWTRIILTLERPEITS
jgi:hypothetical protein